MNKTASQRGTARLRHSANPITTGAAYSLTKYKSTATWAGTERKLVTRNLAAAPWPMCADAAAARLTPTRTLTMAPGWHYSLTSPVAEAIRWPGPAAQIRLSQWS